MYQRIVVALDGSPTADLALREAMNLAKTVGGQLLLVHAVDEVSANWDTGYLSPAEIWQAMAAAGRDILKNAAATAHAAGINADTKLIEIDTVGRRIPEVIAAAADEWHAELIVVGTHGRRGLSHLFLGSVAEGIVRVASKPILLIRAR